MIEFDRVTKVFGSGETSVRAIDDLSFQCPPGSFWSIMGPSGSGKSTILHLIAGLTQPTAGRILVNGVDVARMNADEVAKLRREQIGYVMQSFNLLPYLTVEENVGLPLVLGGVSDTEIRPLVQKALSRVNIAHRASHSPSYLSGGEQQRVAIARALAIDPTIVLADEPTGNLDRAGGRAIIDLLQDLNERSGVTILLVTHDPIFAASARLVLRLLDGALEQHMDLSEDADPTAGVVH